MSSDKSNENNPDSGAKPESVDETRKKRIRSLILGSIAASGAFQLNSWQAQAHGNRSSHPTASLRSDLFLPQDYISFRQELLAPNSQDTMLLSRLTGRLNDLRGPDPAASLNLKSEEVAALQGQIDELEDKLRLRDSSRMSLEFLREGDIDGAAAAIEGEGDPDRVTYEYLWTITDLAYLDRQGDRLTDKNLEALTALSERAVAYLDGLTARMSDYENLTVSESALLDRAAAIYHNVASYMTPDVGKPSKASAELGYDAARKALALRERLEQPKETVIAQWVLGSYESRLGNPEEARRIHKSALRRAKKIKDPVQAAWNEFALSRLERAADGVTKSAARDDERVSKLLGEADPSDPAAALLRLELARDAGE